MLLAGSVALLGLAGLLIWSSSPDEEYVVFDGRDVSSWPSELFTGTRFQIQSEQGEVSVEEGSGRQRVELGEEGPFYQSYGSLAPELAEHGSLPALEWSAGDEEGPARHSGGGVPSIVGSVTSERYPWVRSERKR